MNQYTIYCTEEQTKKALELGAPIRRIPISGHDGSRPSYFTKSPDEEGWAECPAYYIPTAEQMIGWLLERVDDINIIKAKNGTWLFALYPENTHNYQLKNGFTSRKEATLAAIDTALEYLIKNKK